MSWLSLQNVSVRAARLRVVLISVGVLIVGFSLWFTNRLANRLRQDEQQRIELWADATRQLILADEHTDLDFITSIIEQNTTIPVVMVDSVSGKPIESRNIVLPETGQEAYLMRRAQTMGQHHAPIVLRVAGNMVQYIYYDDSVQLRQLRLFGWLQMGIILLLALLAYAAYSAIKRAEQNNVWIGLSKETAHQLGTPISSLMSWSELLRAQYPDDKLLDELDKDTDRLQSIAERFSQIGSQPVLQPADVLPVVQGCVDYMRRRSPRTIDFVIQPVDNSQAMINLTLLSWAVENLCRNAVDAMSGMPQGRITVQIAASGRFVHIDVTDTGRGIEHSHHRDMFRPGYTTKQRGWGLGLSLARRIVEDYHGGQIYVKQSEPGRGTTIRIRLCRYQ